MTTGPHEHAVEHARQLHGRHRKASEAMMCIIALRNDEGRRSPDLDPNSYEGHIRADVFRLQHDLLQLDPEEKYAESRHKSLAESLTSPYLYEMAQPGRPLTRDRLMQLDPQLIEVADRMETEGIGWPDDETVFHDVLPEDFDDFAFGRRLVERGRAYNNFPAILRAEPSTPNENENMVEFMNRTKFFQYASKPYLVRAHAIQPEFMGALQSLMDHQGSADDWAASLYDAVTHEYPDPDDRILLRASRIAYQLLINLMRSDDLQTQGRLLTMTARHEITDPIVELWT
jgi:hypothetical protein